MADLLRVDDLSAGYGGATILNAISFAISAGQSLALLGRNGTGKTTLINSVVGLTERHSGAIALNGQDITAMRPDQRAALGIGWVPQERNIFRSLTVAENLTATARPGPWNSARVYALFPRLHERRENLGTQLSGGEQQLLAIGRALMLNPQVLLLDEALEGLAPIAAEHVLSVVRKLIRDEGMSAIVVEQKAMKILEITDHALILERGEIAYSASADTLMARPDILETYLGVKLGGDGRKPGA